MYFFFFFFFGITKTMYWQSKQTFVFLVNLKKILKKGSVIELFQSYKFQVLECKYSFFPLEQDQLIAKILVLCFIFLRLIHANKKQRQNRIRFSRSKTLGHQFFTPSEFTSGGKKYNFLVSKTNITKSVSKLMYQLFYINK